MWLEVLQCTTQVVPASGGGIVGAMGLEDLQELAAFARQHLKKSRSVRLSSLNPSKWGDITRNAGTNRDMPSVACIQMNSCLKRDLSHLRSHCLGTKSKGPTY